MNSLVSTSSVGRPCQTPSASPRKSGWIMTQTWHDLLFAHWPVSPEQLRPSVPSQLEIDTLAGNAWLGIVVFRLSGVRLRGLPEVPFLSAFPEINVRTYVSDGNQSGVYFLSLDTNNPLAIAIARPWFRLAYFSSRISFTQRGDGIRFTSRRVQRGAPSANFSGRYSARSCTLNEPSELARWLAERYCFYACDSKSGQNMYRCDIAHRPWTLQHAQATIVQNTMALSHGIELPAVEPLLLYARYMKAHVWRVVKVQS